MFTDFLYLLRAPARLRSCFFCGEVFLQPPIHSPLLSAWKTPLAFLSLQGSDKNKNFSLARTFFLCDDDKKGKKFRQEDDS